MHSNGVTNTLRFRAFLSYAHADTAWAKVLHRQLENFPIDKDLAGRETQLGPVPKSLRPIFRDREDFVGGHSLTEATIAALAASAALIVVCSPAAAASKNVNEEVRLFRWRHPDRPVIPVIVAGKHPGNFPAALRFEIGADGTVTERVVTILGPDVRETGDGRDLAVAKVVAGLLGLASDDIYRRAERARRRAARIRKSVAAAIVALAVIGGVATWQWRASQQTVVSYDAALERGCKDYLEKFREQCDRKDLSVTLERIAKAAAEGKDPRSKQALDLIAAGKSAEAAPVLRALAVEEAARGQAAVKRAAERYRTTGAIAFLSDTQAALNDYRRATELDPDNADGWNRLGQLLLRTGDLDQAINVFEHVLVLGNSSNDQQLIAAATGNLGIVFQTRGDLAQAEIMHRKSLALNEALGTRVGMAITYGNLGAVYQKRGNPDDAEAMYLKAIDLFDALGLKEGMAINFGNLGNIYQMRGDLARAEEMYRKSISLGEALGLKDSMAKELAPFV